ncbi:NAD(P)H-dependent flavin oxidoreductase [Cryptosporangium phraense]|uniref:Nitronate monooxygenase n=1 Tax=Cryptosporangium phraense TaxID=2593070 RepID=A0A545AM45_9ACTN|nr:nitronate monooxygenase family protein [Cryptosporangium phraense]TQS42402.1 nitronate monooxygenase [Cryptosporangium phraense]
MKTAICDLLGVDLPLLAFSHCRDVVAEVSLAGGFGVLGGSMFTPEQLEAELAWIDAHVGGRPYGVDIIVPERVSAMQPGAHADASDLLAAVPEEHRAYVDEILAAHGVPPAGRSADAWSVPSPDDLLDVAFSHPIKLIANALGVPPAVMLERGHAAGVPVAALVGAREHAIRQVEAGVDIIVAQGTEAGGHCGEVTTMVLIPEVVAAVAPVPVLAAGGIVTGAQMAASIALGAAGVWTGSVWLTTPEAETAPYTREKLLRATSRDTVRSKGRTGKPSRQLRSPWTDAWAQPDAPQPLPMPFQTLISEPALRHVDALAAAGDAGAQELATYWVGQGVGLMNEVKSTRDVVYEMASDYADAAARVAATID